MSASSASGRTLGDALSILVPPSSGSGASSGSSDTKKRDQPKDPSDVIAELLPVVLHKKRKFARVSVVGRDAQINAKDKTQGQEEVNEWSDSSGKEEGNQAEKEKDTKCKEPTESAEGKEDAMEGAYSESTAGVSPGDPSNSLDYTMRDLLKERLKRLKEDNERVLKKRQQALARHRDFLGLYEFALDRISRLNDLRDAPDAILPGNFPDTY